MTENRDRNRDRDQRPSQTQLIDAVNQLIRDGLITADEKPKQKNAKVAKSMPSIFEKAKESFTNSHYPIDSSKISKLNRIFENAQDKENGAKTLEQLDLPRYRRIKTTIGEFLQDPDKYFNSLKLNLYFPSVMDEKTGVRFFDLGLDKKATLNFVKNLIDKQAVSPDYSFTLSEYQENKISGNIIINPIMVENHNILENSGEISIEIVEGEHSGLAYGDKSPILIAKTNLANSHPDVMNFDVTLKTAEFSEPLIKKINPEMLWQPAQSRKSYASFLLLKEIVEHGDIYLPVVDEKNREKDQEAILRYQKLIEQTTEILHLIPKDQDNGSNFSVDGQAFHPGYYEFIVSPNGKPFFIDYREAKNYSNLQHNNREDVKVSD